MKIGKIIMAIDSIALIILGLKLASMGFSGPSKGLAALEMIGLGVAISCGIIICAVIWIVALIFLIWQKKRHNKNK